MKYDLKAAERSLAAAIKLLGVRPPDVATMQRDGWLTVDQICEATGQSDTTVKRELRNAAGWERSIACSGRARVNVYRPRA